MSGDLSSHYGAGGISWWRLSLNSPRLLPYKSLIPPLISPCSLTAAMDGEYLPVTYGDENPDTQFLVHNSISTYTTKLLAMGSRARAIKLALLGHTPYVIANIPSSLTGHFHGTNVKSWMNGWHNCRSWASLGDFNDGVWGRPSEPTRYWHPLVESGDLMGPMLAHVENIDPQNLATHC